MLPAHFFTKDRHPGVADDWNGFYILAIPHFAAGDSSVKWAAPGATGQDGSEKQITQVSQG